MKSIFDACDGDQLTEEFSIPGTDLTFQMVNEFREWCNVRRGGVRDAKLSAEVYDQVVGRDPDRKLAHDIGWFLVEKEKPG